MVQYFSQSQYSSFLSHCTQTICWRAAMGASEKNSTGGEGGQQAQREVRFTTAQEPLGRRKPCFRQGSLAVRRFPFRRLTKASRLPPARNPRRIGRGLSGEFRPRTAILWMEIEL